MHCTRLIPLTKIVGQLYHAGFMFNRILIDPISFARTGQTQDGACVLAALSARAGLASEQGRVAWTLTGFVDDMLCPSLRIDLVADVRVACRYCLKPLVFELTSHAVLALFTDESKLEVALREREGLDAIVVGKELDIAALIEDEIIMGLPLSPAHEVCNIDSLASVKGGAPGPFAVLATLKEPPQQ